MKTIFKPTKTYGMLFMLCLILTAIPFIKTNAAGTVEVYVLTSTEQKESDLKTTYSYNSKGLLSKSVSSSGTNTTNKYTYKNGLLTKSSSKNNYSTEKVTFSYDKKKRLVQENRVYVSGNDVFKTKEVYFYNKKNQIIKSNYEEDGPEALAGVTVFSFSYDKKGHLAKSKSKYGISKYSYDAKGFLKKVTYGSSATTLKNTYKNGLLIRRVQSNKDEDYSAKVNFLYQYKKIKVPKSYVSLVKEQQNNILDLSVGGHSFTL